jgi:PAS domain S-box-containing protein
VDHVTRKPNITTHQPSISPRCSIAHDLPMAVIITDGQGVVTTWSPEAERLYGWTASAAVGTPIQELTVGPTEASLAAAIMDTVLRGQAWEGVFTARRRDGTTIEVHVIDLPVSGVDGQIAGIVGLSFDVSPSRANLRTEVDRLAEIASWEAQVRSAERHRIAGDLHDELGQLLTVMSSELLGWQNVPRRPRADDLRRLLALTQSCLAEVRRICSDLVAKPLDLPGLAQRLDDMIKELSHRTEITATFTLDPSLTDSDPPLLVWPAVVDVAWHITLEALTNAERHAHANHIAVWLWRDDAHLVGEVSDDGCGIDHDGAIPSGRGLHTMKERALTIGGSVEVLGREPGTLVGFRLPLTPRP